VIFFTANSLTASKKIQRSQKKLKLPDWSRNWNTWSTVFITHYLYHNIQKYAYITAASRKTTDHITVYRNAFSS